MAAFAQQGDGAPCRGGQAIATGVEVVDNKQKLQRFGPFHGLSVTRNP